MQKAPTNGPDTRLDGDGKARRQGAGRSQDGKSSKRSGRVPTIVALALAFALVAAVAAAGGALGYRSLATTPTPSPVTGPVAQNELEVLPASVTVAVGDVFAVHVAQTTVADVAGAQSTVVFDHSVLEIQSVTRGSAYAAADVFLPSDIEAAIGSANSSGTLKQTAAMFTPSDNPDVVPAGTFDFLVIKFRALKCGVSRIDLPIGPRDAVLLDGAKGSDYGHTLDIGTVAGSVRVCY